MSGFDTDKIIEELFELLVQRSQSGLETSIKSSKFVFDGVDGLNYKCNKINLDHGGSYIDSPKWLKNKAMINPKNNRDSKCFRFAIKASLNYENIGELERESKIMPYIDQQDCNEINFPLRSKDWKKSKTNNKTIILNVLYLLSNEGLEEIRQAYISKHRLVLEYQVILVMITDGKNWHYLAVKNLSRLSHGIVKP